MMKEDWKLNGDKEKIWLSKGNMNIIFDIVIPTPTGSLYAMYMKRDRPTSTTASTAGEEEKKANDVDECILKKRKLDALQPASLATQVANKKLFEASGAAVTKGSI